MAGCWHGYLSGARCRLAYAQLMPLPLTISCSSKIQIDFTFLVPAHLGSPGQRAVKRVCVCVCVCVSRGSNNIPPAGPPNVFLYNSQPQTCKSVKSFTHVHKTPTHSLRRQCCNRTLTLSDFSLLSVSVTVKKCDCNFSVEIKVVAEFQNKIQWAFF